LRAAKGPLAPMFQAVLPGDYGFKQILAGPGPQPKDPKAKPDDKNPDDPDQKMLAEVKNAFGQIYSQFVSSYPLRPEQKKAADAVYNRTTSLYEAWIGENTDAINDWFHERDRLTAARSLASATEVPYQEERIADAKSKLDAEAAGWLKNVRTMEHNYRLDLEQVLDTEQLSAGSMSSPSATLRTVDAVMTYGILTIGVLLFLGLFTRLASLAGAAFLLSVVLTQPFWVSETTPTFNQLVEMFALLTLATTNVGRWAGLDFFIHYLLLQPCCAAKGSSNESKS
jgi:uncharacterized membrane protein YphA (DoxX/SURF4 family)